MKLARADRSTPRQICHSVTLPSTATNRLSHSAAQEHCLLYRQTVCSTPVRTIRIGYDDGLHVSGLLLPQAEL